jgi:hypothetical protein
MDLCKYSNFYYVEIIMFGKITFIKRQLRPHFNVIHPDVVNILLRPYDLIIYLLYKLLIIKLEIAEM